LKNKRGGEERKKGGKREISSGVGLSKTINFED
jgi:hypothetical protein